MPVITELLARLGVDPRDFEKNLKKAEKTLRKSADKMIAIGRDLTLGLTAPLAGIGAIAVKSFADFDDALRKSAAIMTGAEGRMDELANAAREVGKASTFGATEAAEAFFFLASAGFNAEQSIGALSKVVKFAEAGNFDLATATDLLTDAQSAMGLASKNAEENLKNLVRVSDVLVGANTLANASTRQFSEALTAGAGAAARTAGLEIEEVVAILAAYADQGIKGADASTKLRVALRDLQSKAFANAEVFERLKVTVFDANGALLPMSKILASLEKRFEGMSAKQRIATIRQLGFADKSKAALESLLGFSAQIAESTKKLKAMGGVTEEVARKNLASFSSQMKILKNQVIDVAIALGSELVPIIQDMVIPVIQDAIELVRGIIEGFSGLDKGTKEAIVSFVAFVAAIGPVILAGGAFLTIVLALASPIAIIAILLGGVGFALIEVGKRFLGSADAAAAYRGEMVGATKAMQDAAKAGRKLEEQLQLNELRAARAKVEAADQAIRDLAETIARENRKGTFTLKQAEEGKRQLEELRQTAKRLQFDLEDLSRSFREQSLNIDVGGGEEGILALVTNIGEGLRGVADIGVESSAMIRDSFNLAIQEMDENSRAVFGNIGETISQFREVANEAWNSWLATSQDVIANVQLAAIDFLESFSAGFGDAIARIVVFQEDFKEVFKSFLKGLLAQVISTLAQIVVQWLLSTILQATIGTAGHIQRVGQALQMIFLNTWASIAAIPIVGPAIAPGAAAGALAASSTASIAAAALGPAVGGAGSLSLESGGLTTADGLAFLHAGEVVATPDEVKDAMSGRPNMLTINLHMDGRLVARTILPHIPTEVNMRGA